MHRHRLFSSQIKYRYLQKFCTIGNVSQVWRVNQISDPFRTWCCTLNIGFQILGWQHGTFTIILLTGKARSLKRQYKVQKSFDDDVTFSTELFYWGQPLGFNASSCYVLRRGHDPILLNAIRSSCFWIDDGGGATASGDDEGGISAAAGGVFCAAVSDAKLLAVAGGTPTYRRGPSAEAKAAVAAACAELAALRAPWRPDRRSGLRPCTSLLFPHQRDLRIPRKPLSLERRCVRAACPQPWLCRSKRRSPRRVPWRCSWSGWPREAWWASVSGCGARGEWSVCAAIVNAAGRSLRSTCGAFGQRGLISFRAPVDRLALGCAGAKRTNRRWTTSCRCLTSCPTTSCRCCCRKPTNRVPCAVALFLAPTCLPFLFHRFSQPFQTSFVSF